MRHRTDTPSRKTEDELSTGVLLKLLNEVSDSIEVTDPKTLRFIYFNEATLKMHGYDGDEFRALSIRDIDPYIDPEELKRINTNLHEHRAVLFESAHQRRDGSSFPVEVHISLVEIDGRDWRLAVVRDISERKEAEQAITEYAMRLETAMHQTLTAISEIVEQRDPYTAGHERRVAAIARDIAQEMGWTEERCRQIEQAGLIHDIGKVSIPAEILSKPALLTSTEQQLIQTHVEKSYEILKRIEFPFPLAEFVYQHHERMDGSGYPRGLKGDEISPEARILAIADVLESMVTHRPYRPALGIDVALQEITGNRGSLYDPAAVDALLRLVSREDYHLPEIG